MKCIPDGILLAKVHGELPDAELKEVNNHLASCSECQRREETIRLQSERVIGNLSALSPLPGEAQADPSAAYAQFRLRQVSPENISPVGALFTRRLRPVWGAVALAALGTAFLSLAPARSWGQKILAMLRVQKITVVSLDPAVLTGRDGRPEKMIGQLISDNLVVTMKPGEPEPVANAEQASSLAGFKVRLPGNRADAPRLRVQGEAAFHMTVNRERMQAIFDEAGRSDLILPASIDGATIAVQIPKLVGASYGKCPEPRKGEGNQRPTEPESRDFAGCVVLLEVPSPTVSVPPELNLEQVAEAGLQLGGMSAEEARAFCQTVDWTSTLVIPVPRQGASVETTEVDGVKGTLISTTERGRRPAEFGLLWVKNGIIYSLMGAGSSADAVSMADSLN